MQVTSGSTEHDTQLECNTESFLDEKPELGLREMHKYLQEDENGQGIGERGWNCVKQTLSPLNLGHLME